MPCGARIVQDKNFNGPKIARETIRRRDIERERGRERDRHRRFPEVEEEEKKNHQATRAGIFSSIIF
jgi:hypothetical protein